MKLPRLLPAFRLLLALASLGAGALAASAPPASVTQARARLTGKWSAKMIAGAKTHDYVWEITGDGLLYDVTETGKRELSGEIELLSTSRALITMVRDNDFPYVLLMNVTFDDTITIESRTNRMIFKLGPPPTPEVQRVMNTQARAESEKRGIMNNLRQLSAASDQYFLENGVSIVSIEKLIGPTNYIKSLTPIAGEDYSGMVFVQGRTIYVKTRDGRVFNYDP